MLWILGLLRCAVGCCDEPSWCCWVDMEEEKRDCLICAVGRCLLFSDQ